MPSILQLNEFFVEGNNHRKSHVLLNITEPSTPEEKEKGYFFAICEIENGDNKYLLKMQNMIDEVENGYYETKDFEDKNSLELVLNKINQKSFAIIRPGINLNCIIGSIQDNKVLFSFFGKPQILLFYKAKHNIYKKIDLLKDNLEDDDTNDKEQIFSQIVEGKISPNDFFFISTAKVEKYFNHDRLQKIIASRPPRQSAEHLERVLRELKNEMSFGGMIMHMQKGEENKTYTKKTGRKGGSARSLKGLFSNQKDTANILSPSILPNLMGLKLKVKNKQQAEKEEIIDERTSTQTELPIAEINSSHKKERSHLEDVEKTAINTSLVSRIIKLLSKGLIQVGKLIYWLFIIFGTILIKLGQGLGSLFIVLINHKGRRFEIVSDWKMGLSNFKKNILRIPLSLKIMIIFSFLLLIFLVVTLIQINNKKIEANKYAQFKKDIVKITNSIDSAESYIIYNETDKALSLLQNTEKQLNLLDCSNNRAADCNETANKLNIILSKVRKLYIIDATELTDWTKLNGQSNADTLTVNNKKLFGINDITSTIYSYDLVSKDSLIETTNLTLSGIKTGITPKENDYTAFINGNDKMLMYINKDNLWKNVDISYPNDNAEISSIFIYSRRLYSVDKQNQQIYRHESTETGFARGRQWLSDEKDNSLTNNIGLAIDGDLYTASKDGGVNKYNAGLKQDFQLGAVDPAITNLDEIWTYYELKYLYLLDSSNKRLIIIDKQDGRLVKQLTSSSFTKPTGMVIDEVNNTGYILDNNKVYQLDLGL